MKKLIIGFAIGFIIALINLCRVYNNNLSKVLAWIIFFLTLLGLIYPIFDFYQSKNFARSKLPANLDYQTTQRIEFGREKETAFNFESDEAQIDFHLSSYINKKEDRYFISTYYNLEDKKTGSSWKLQQVEVELSENNLIKGQTDRLDIYFYVSKTHLGYAILTIGFKIVQRGIVIKHHRLVGNVFKFTDKLR